MSATTRYIGSLLGAGVLTVAIGACGSSSSSSTSGSAASTAGKGKPPLTLGAKNFTEEHILGALYQQALAARGYSVTLKDNIGSSEITDKAMTSGQIDGYPEYTGTILSEIAHQTNRPSDADTAYNRAKAFEQGRGFSVLDRTPATDTDAIAVLPDYAATNGLHTIGDLKKVAARASLGGPPEFKTRYQGLVGMAQAYGVRVSFKPLAIGLQYQALNGGQIQAANVFTTDGQLSRRKYTVLSDPRNIMGFQNVVMVFSRKKLAAEGPAFAQTINAVSAKLTTEALQRMNAAVDLDKQSPAAVARQFLKANGLV